MWCTFKAIKANHDLVILLKSFLRYTISTFQGKRCILKLRLSNNNKNTAFLYCWKSRMFLVFIASESPIGADLQERHNWLLINSRSFSLTRVVRRPALSVTFKIFFIACIIGRSCSAASGYFRRKLFAVCFPYDYRHRFTSHAVSLVIEC